ncbi:MAG: hypothetical protein IJZ00_08515 [Lachnospiraceae bacterium]|nr:hypothetical protein [Lachnospiraceae bacterium]
MSSSEDYLDSLLANALQQNTEPEPETEVDVTTPESDKMSPEEISALFDMLDAEKEEPAFDLDAMLDKVIAESSESMAEENYTEKTLMKERNEVPGDFQKVVEENATLEELTQRFEAEPEIEPEAGELLAEPEPEIEPEAGELLAEPEPEIEPEAEGLLAEPEPKFDAEDLLAQLEEIDDEDEEDIETKLAAAKQLGEQQAKEANPVLDESDDLLKLLDSFGEEDESVAEIGDMLKKSDEKELIDHSVAEVPAMAEVMAAWDEAEENEEAPQEETGKKAKKKKGLKEFFSFGKKKKKEEQETENTPLEESLNDAFSMEAPVAPQTESIPEQADPFTALDDAGGFADFNALFDEMATESEEASLAEQLGLTDVSTTENESGDRKKEEEQTSSAGFSGGAKTATAAESAEGDKESAKEKKDKKEKKPGFFQRLFNALTEEVPEEDNSAVPEKKATKLSEENLNILNELDSEELEETKKGKKKGKKDKDKEKKKKAKKKPDKPKKVKVLSDEKEDGKKIPRKHILNTFALSFSILFAIILITLYVPSLVNLQDAREDYYQGNYMDAYFAMYGKDLNESDRLLYEKARLIVILERKLESYQNYSAMNMREDALDVLLQGLARYEDLKEQGADMDVLPQMDEIRAQMLSALASDFNLSEEDAMEIIAYSPLDYSDRIQSIINGTEFVPRGQAIAEEYGISYGENGLGIGGENAMGTDASEEVPGDNSFEEGSTDMPDLLPEEEAYLNGEITEP